jgi:PAS domain S-box-containing protein
MVYVIDLNGRFVDVNNSVIEKLGYSKEELLLLGPVNIDHTLRQNQIENLINNIPSDKVQYFETNHITKAGETIPVEIKSTLITYKGSQLILSIARDISDRKKADVMLKASEEKYRTMITQMQLGVAIHDIIYDDKNTPVDYRFIDVNPSFERLTGLKRESVIGKRVLEIMPDTEKTWIEKYGYVALTGEPLQFEDYSKGLDRYFSVVAFRPRPTQFAVIVDDITDRKIAEAELVERMNEITRFNNLMVGREEKMIELKKEINDLLKKLGKEKKYDVIEEELLK